MSHLSGTLQVRVEFARLTKQVTTFSRQDPYVRLTVGHVTQRTTVATDQVFNPRWNQSFTYSLSPTTTTLYVAVYHDSTINDVLIGQATLSLLNPFGGSLTLNLTDHKGRSSGSICLVLTHYPAASHHGGHCQPSYAPPACTPGYPPTYHPPTHHVPVQPAPYYPHPGPTPGYVPPSTYPPAPTYPPSSVPTYPPAPAPAYPPHNPYGTTNYAPPGPYTAPSAPPAYSAPPTYSAPPAYSAPPPSYNGYPGSSSGYPGARY